MSIGETLYELRKNKHYSQEEVAEKLNVTRQTISKWETDQSTPDFDKIAPLCDLYGITSDELLRGEKKKENPSVSKEDSEIVKKRAIGIGAGVFGYFLALSWIIISEATFDLNDGLTVSIFMLLCGLSTAVIIYSCIFFKGEKRERTEQEEKNNSLYKMIDGILGLLTLIVYLVVSFLTGAWYITWIIWIIYGLISQIVKLIIYLKGGTIVDEE